MEFRIGINLGDVVEVAQKNTGLIDALENRLDTEQVRLGENPQIIGTLVAALFAEKNFRKKSRSMSL